MHPIAYLVDEAKFYWALLETAVRLERPWHVDLAVMHHDAEKHAVLLGRSIAAGQCEIDTLADLRELVMHRARNVLHAMEESLPTGGLHAHTRDFMHRKIEEVSDIAALLLRGVDVRSCRCTPKRSARRQLVRQLSLDTDAGKLIDSAGELIKLTCAQAQRLLADCLGDHWVTQDLQGAALHRPH